MKRIPNSLNFTTLPTVYFLIIFFAAAAFGSVLAATAGTADAASRQHKTADRPITDADWTPMNPQGIAGIDVRLANRVSALLYRNGSLYAGGTFIAIGGTNANRIAKWNGRQWTSLGSGISGSTIRNTSTAFANNQTSVAALAIDSNGTVFAGGCFDSAGGAPASLVAKWDGSTWSGLGSGITLSSPWDYVGALACDRTGNLFVGGRFSLAGNTAVSNIAKWDGSAWEPLGQGIQTGNSGTPGISALAFDAQGNLYAAGQFQSAGGISVRGLAIWNGVQWSDVPGLTTCERVNDLALDRNGNVYISGTLQPGSASISKVAKWNGSAWDSLGTGLDAPAAALACDSNGNLFAGGHFSIAGGTSAGYIAQWNGSAWSPLGEGISGEYEVYSIACGADGGIFAAGGFKKAGSVNTYGIAVWNGSAWNQPGEGSDGAVHAIVKGDHGTVYICGEFTVIGATPARHVVAWDKTGWHPLGPGINGTVSYLAYDGRGTLYAAGMFDSAGGKPARNIAAWDGSSWRPLGSGSPQDITGLVCDKNGLLYAGGPFDSIGGIRANRVAQWDKTSWRPLGSGFLKLGPFMALTIDGNGDLLTMEKACSGEICGAAMKRWRANELDLSLSTKGDLMGWGEVTALAVDPGGVLYAGTVEATTYGQTSRISRWDGSAWSQSLPIIRGHLYSMTFDTDGALYLGGFFDSAGGIAARSIVRVKDSRWSAVGSGTDVAVKSLAVMDSTLFVGGYFLNAGKAFSPYIARVNIHTSPSNTIRTPSNPAQAPSVTVKRVKSALVFSDIPADSRISLFSLSGSRLRETTGNSPLHLAGIAPQTLVVEVSAKSAVVMKRLIFAH